MLAKFVFRADDVGEYHDVDDDDGDGDDADDNGGGDDNGNDDVTTKTMKKDNSNNKYEMSSIDKQKKLKTSSRQEAGWHKNRPIFKQGQGMKQRAEFNKRPKE